MFIFVIIYFLFIIWTFFVFFFLFLFFVVVDTIRQKALPYTSSRKHFVCTGNSAISRDLCNANTYQSIHEWVFFNCSPALDLKYPLKLPYIHFCLSLLHLHFKINGSHSYIFQPIRLTLISNAYKLYAFY